jgi:hypothetical protein
MSPCRILLATFVITPSILCYVFTKQVGISVVFCLANLSVLAVRKPRLVNTFVLTLLYLETLLILHLFEHEHVSKSAVVPVDADNPSFGYLSVPFVSLVLIGADSTLAAARWRSQAPPSLIKEVLVYGEAEPQGDFTVFVNTGADPVGENFLALLVREIMNTSENDKVVFVPSVLVDGHEFSHAVYDGAIVRKFDEPKLSKVWVVPEISAFVVRTKFVSLVQGLASGALVEGSHDVWRCGGAIKLATLAKMRVNAPMSRQTRTASSCEVEVSDDQINKIFSDYLPPSKSFKIAFGSRCLTYKSSLTLGMFPCTEDDGQLFSQFDDGRALRNAGSCTAANASPSCFCLDVGPNPTEGKPVNFYFCRPNTISQQIEIFGNRLMWGSYCVNSDLKLQRCEGSNLDIAVRI